MEGIAIIGGSCWLLALVDDAQVVGRHDGASVLVGCVRPGQHRLGPLGRSSAQHENYYKNSVQVASRAEVNYVKRLLCFITVSEDC